MQKKSRNSVQKAINLISEKSLKNAKISQKSQNFQKNLIWIDNPGIIYPD